MKAATALHFFLVLFSTALRTAQAFNLFGTTNPPKHNANRRKHERIKQPATPAVPPYPPEEEPMFELPEIGMPNPLTPGLWNSMTSAVLGLAARMAPRQIQNEQMNNCAARITINRIPPQSFKVDLTDVPIVGKALSGTYAKVKDESVTSKPSVVIASPRDKGGFVRHALNDRSVGLGMSGLLSTTFDIQVEPNRPGMAPLLVKSPLIPKWPFGAESSDWNKVTNMGNGRLYYFNSKTGQVQYEEPEELS